MATPALVKQRMIPPEFPRLFDAQYAEFDEDLPLWLSLAAEAAGPVLELGCGTGRVLAALANAGRVAEGLDRDPHMLARSARRLAARDVPLHCADLRHFQLEGQYALILVPCNTFAQLDDREASSMLACARRHLLPGGRLAAELPTPGEAHALPAAADGPLATFFEPETGNPVQLSAECSASPDGRLVKVLWHYDELQPDGQVRRTTVPAAFHLRRRREVRQLLRKAGFASIQFLGDYDGSPYRPGAPHLIALGEVE